MQSLEIHNFVLSTISSQTHVHISKHFSYNNYFCAFSIFSLIIIVFRHFLILLPVHVVVVVVQWFEKIPNSFEILYWRYWKRNVLMLMIALNIEGMKNPGIRVRVRPKWVTGKLSLLLLCRNSLCFFVGGEENPHTEKSIQFEYFNIHI